jgi:NAD(P)-dependent dehydrogenase (short-subunit alcohol dehydrogenase family)
VRAVTVDPQRLDGRVAVVTGAARGIGAAIAERLAELGSVVVSADVSPPDDWSATDLRARGAPDASMHQLDVGDDTACRRLVETVRRRHGRLDVLVNNAGVNARRAAADTDGAEWARVLDTNLGGTVRMSLAALPLLRSGEDAAVVNLGSTAGAVAIAGAAAYGVSKAAVMHLSRILAVEWARDGIRVNAVAPTIVPTGMTADVRSSQEYLRDKLASIPLGRMAHPAEVASAVVYLASPAAAMITGEVLFVDGGASVR